MSDTKKGVNYVAVEQFLDQLRKFIINRYVEIYNCNPIEDDPHKLNDKDKYWYLLCMLEAIYDEDHTIYEYRKEDI